MAGSADPRSGVEVALVADHGEQQIEDAGWEWLDKAGVRKLAEATVSGESLCSLGNVLGPAAMLE